MCNKCASYLEGFMEGLNMDPNSDCTKAFKEVSKCISSMSDEISFLKRQLEIADDRINDLEDAIDYINGNDGCCDCCSCEDGKCDCSECDDKCPCDGKCDSDCDCGCKE